MAIAFKEAQKLANNSGKPVVVPNKRDENIFRQTHMWEIWIAQGDDYTRKDVTLIFPK